MTEVVGQVCPVMIQNGDAVLVFFHGRLDAQTIHAIQAHLTKELPFVQFTLIDQVASVLVKRDGDA